MRPVLLTAVLILASTTAAAADPAPRKSKARDEAAAALALAASCDCPTGARPKCGDVAEVLARVSAELALESAHPAVAPPPRVKAAPKCGCADGKCLDCAACECPRAATPVSPDARVVPTPMPTGLPPAFLDASGCTWTPGRAADGSVVWTRTSCPLRR